MIFYACRWGIPHKSLMDLNFGETKERNNKMNNKMVMIYKVVANGEVNRFETMLTEKDFFKILDSVYGIGNWSVVDIDFRY